jgi:P-type Cu2+ transporter
MRAAASIAPIALAPPPVVDPVDHPADLAAFSQITGSGADAVALSWLQLSGLHCAACAGVIEQALSALPGVLDARVNAAAMRAAVRWKPAATSVAQLLAAVRAAGYEAEPDTAAGTRRQREREGRLALWRLFVAGFCAMQIMMFATPAYVAGAGELAPDLRHLFNLASWVLALPVMGFSAGAFFRGAARSLAQRRIGMDVPVALGLAVGFAASTAATFAPGSAFGSEVYFDSLAMFVSFLLLARWLESQARARAAQALEAGQRHLPEQALRVAADGSVQTVRVQALAAGDRLRVPVGDTFPADGVVIAGLTVVDEALMSGESQALRRGMGDEVLAGSVNIGAPIEIRAVRCGADTRAQAVAALMREAAMGRSGTTRLADRIAGPFLWAVLLLAAAAAAVWSQIDPARAVVVAVSVLIVTCPCALSLAAPSAWLASAGAMARRGLLLRRIDAIEAMAGVDHVVLDKTGTATQRSAELARVHLIDRGADPAGTQACLRAAAALAAWSAHPLAAALTAAAGPAELRAAGRWQGVTETAGCGLEAHDDSGICWRLGSPSWVSGGQRQDTSGARLAFGRVGHPVALFEFDERLRDGVVQAVSRWRAQGVSVSLLSGDTRERVDEAARRLGIAASDTIARASPQDKQAWLAQRQAGGARVAMVGDGINDAPVLAQADVSIAMGEGAGLARSQADAVLIGNDVAVLPELFDHARRTVRVIRQNLAWAALYNAACVPMALAGWLPPWLAGLGMAASSLLVVGNSLRLAR